MLAHTGKKVFHHGRLFLADLAGSERIPKHSAGYVHQAHTHTHAVSHVPRTLTIGPGRRSGYLACSADELRETQHVNRSLAALGDVIEGLGQNQSYIPYRNSKLTFLLQESLSVGSRTMMILAVPPTATTAPETLFTIQFASRVRRLELGPTALAGGKHVQRLEQTVAAMRKALHSSQKDKQILEQQLLVLRRRTDDMRGSGGTVEEQRLRQQIAQMKARMVRNSASGGDGEGGERRRRSLDGGAGRSPTRRSSSGRGGGRAGGGDDVGDEEDGHNNDNDGEIAE